MAASGVQFRHLSSHVQKLQSFPKSRSPDLKVRKTHKQCEISWARAYHMYHSYVKFERFSQYESENQMRSNECHELSDIVVTIVIGRRRKK